MYSYTIYDYKGRITEAGEISSDSLPVTTGGGFIEQTDVDAFIAAAGTRAQVTRSYYNSSPFSATMDTLFRPLGQENLRNRIAVMTYTETYGVDTAYDFATHYSYDVLGNVKTLMQDIKELASRNNRYKRIDYEYDLQSGKVNRVIYQKDSVDQYMYVYEYDADNRLSETTSGPNEMFMKTESVQSYYDHGPLFRTQLGEERVQGMDYAYTLQGWLKGVNGSGLNAAKDIGRDGYISGGNLNQPVARDAFGFTLNYFNGTYDGGTTLYHDGDYTPVTPATATFAAAVSGTGGAFDTHGKDLFNGNIRYTTLQLKGIDTVPIAYAYRFDQLQRLKEMNYFNASINASTYSLTNATAASGDYHEAYSYDGNGNILMLDRRGYYSSGQDEMDSLTYAYTSGTNRLSQISDIINVANYSVDLDSVNNYTYDESGNLKTDAKERISDVTWSPYGKIKNITKSLDTVLIAYSYDASMNRVVKKYTSASDTIKTYYIRDAQGNVLAVYTIDSDSLRWTEQHLYGITRLGLTEKNILLNSSTDNVNKPGVPGLVMGIKRNERRYELTNHLGNVISVISDVKRPRTESSNTYFDVDRIAVNDYYSFGMQMPGRKQSLDGYRFGFNGKENDNEVKGEGNQQDYGMRIYDPRVGRFLSRDPLEKKFAGWSPYNYVLDNPILLSDPTGASPDNNVVVNENGEVTEVQQCEGEHTLTMQRQDMTTHSVTLNDPVLDQEQLASARVGDKLVHFLNPENVHYIMNEAGVLSWSAYLSGNIPSAPFLMGLSQSRGGKLDFGLTVLAPQLIEASAHENGYNNVPFAVSNATYSQWDNSGGFIFFTGNEEYKAYNVPDAGNFLWGHAMIRLGANPIAMFLGSNWNDPNGSDTNTDQSAIFSGARYAIKITDPVSNLLGYSKSKPGWFHL